MAVSASGLITLLVLVFLGPVIYLVRYILLRRPVEVQVSKGDDGQEHMSTTAYVFALLGYAIGIGNVWRFPYVISKNGGAAAVIAYVVCAVLVAWPLFIYEMILGQYVRKTFVETWAFIRPRWHSFAWAQFLLLFIAQNLLFGHHHLHVTLHCRQL